MPGLVLQCGGPTAVVNITLAALVRRWNSVRPTDPLQGGRHGLAALEAGDWSCLSEADERWLRRIEASPGMALGGGRDRLSAAGIASAVRLLTARGIHTLFLIGGNGSMEAGRALHTEAARQGASIRIVGIPKTIDNDIPVTAVCPGFPSAARFVAEAVRDVAADAASMRGYEDVVLVEVMGRHTGWLAAATIVARTHVDGAPHMVLVPEAPVSDDLFLDAVRTQHAATGLCVVTVAEGVRDEAGRFLAQKGHATVERDASGQIILGRSGGPLPHLAGLIREHLRLKCRQVRPDVLQRCSRAHVTPLDCRMAAMVGAAAVEHDGSGPVMMALVQSGPEWRTEAVPLEAVRGERTLPGPPESAARWIRTLTAS